MVKKTQQLLEGLKMRGMLDSLMQRLREAEEQDLGYEEFLNLVCEDEVLRRENDRIKRLLKRATLKQNGSLEAFEVNRQRGVERKVLNNIATMRFIQNGQNIIISGPTGVGKSYLACAIGNNACRSGFTVQFYRINTLIEKFKLERAKGNYLNFIKRLTSASVLILDDFGIKPLKPSQYQDFYDVLDERGATGCLVITTQIPVTNWTEVIGDPVICEAITDRIVANAMKIKMQGQSRRKKREGVVDKV